MVLLSCGGVNYLFYCSKYFNCFIGRVGTRLAGKRSSQQHVGVSRSTCWQRFVAMQKEANVQPARWLGDWLADSARLRDVLVRWPGGLRTWGEFFRFLTRSLFTQLGSFSAPPNKDSSTRNAQLQVAWAQIVDAFNLKIGGLTPNSKSLLIVDFWVQHLLPGVRSSFQRIVL